jgi:hypothetical protein
LISSATKNEVVQKGVPRDDVRVFRIEQEFEIIESRPLASPDAVDVIVVFERKDHAVHRDIIVDEQIYDPGQRHQQQPLILF